MLHGIGGDPDVVGGNGPTFGLQSFDNQSIVPEKSAKDDIF